MLEKVMAFTEARHEVLANNISNIDTVGYPMQDLSVAEFDKSLSEAIARREKSGASAPLTLRSTRNLTWDSRGQLHATATEIDSNETNILFHDRNNRFVEKQMSEMSKNALRHQVVAALLKGKYDGLSQAIRGRL